METTQPEVGYRLWRPVRLLRRWWPVPGLVAAAMLAQQLLLTSRYDVGGHAAEHIGSASAPFMAAAVVALTFWATPHARRQLDAIAVAVLWFAATVVVMVGNLRVVDDLVAAGYSHTPTDSVPDIADHSLANASMWWAVLAALGLPIVFRCRRHIGNVALIFALATMIFPPWLIPGAGVVVVLIVRCVAHGRERLPAAQLASGARDKR